MIATRALCSLALVCLLGFSGPSSAEKIDLSPYIGILGTAGDFKLFVRSDGGQRLVTLLSVQPWKKKGWQETVEASVVGTPSSDGTAVFEEYLIPGKRLYSGDEFFEGGITFSVRKPVKSLKLVVNPNKVQQLKKKTDLLLDGAKIGKTEQLEAWAVGGVEDVSTPSGDYLSALRALSSSGLEIEDGGNEFVFLVSQTLWYGAGIGLVRREVFLESYENGFLVDAQNWTEELVSGSIGGVPFP